MPLTVVAHISSSLPVKRGSDYNVDSIGMLWNRSFWFISVSLTELKSLSIGDGRKTNFQMNFSGGLDRSVSPQCELSSIVAVCHNTISLSRATGTVLFNERATKNFTDRLNASKGEISKAVGMAKCFELAMEKLADQACAQSRAERIFAGHLSDAKTEKLSTKTKNIVLELTDLHNNGIGNVGKTEWDMLNAYTQLLTRGGKDAKTSEGRRFTSSEYGSNADAKADFYKLLTVNRSALTEVEERGRKLLAVA